MLLEGSREGKPRAAGWITVVVVVLRGSGVTVAGACCDFSALYLQIHSLYRRTGASFQKAQQEFAAGVFSNPAVRTAAANAAAGAAENAFRAP